MSMLRFAVPLLLLLPISALAQEMRQMTVRCLAFQTRNPPKELFIHDVAAPEGTEGAPVSFKTYLNHQSQTIAVSGSKVVFTTSGDPGSPKKKDEVVAKFELPQRMNRAILLFLPAGKDHPEPFRVMPVDDTRRSFPAGSIQVLNLSRDTVRLALEDSPFEFAPGEFELIEDPPMGAGNMAQMTAFRKAGTSWERVASSRWAHPGPTRSLQIIFTSPRSGRLEMREIKDVAIPDAPGT